MPNDHRRMYMMKRLFAFVIGTFAQAFDASCGGWPDTRHEALIGTWRIEYSEPVVSSHRFFVFTNSAGGLPDNSSGEARLFPEIIVDFDRTLPDRRFFHDGGALDVVESRAIGDTRMGLITLPEGLAGVPSQQLPKSSFVINNHGRLEDVITSFRTYVPGESPYGSRAPYVVYAVDVDGDSEEDAYVIGVRVIGEHGVQRPERPAQTGKWLECTLDDETPVHVWGFRENLQERLRTWNYEEFGRLIGVPLFDELRWGDLDVIFIEIIAGVSAGPPFKAYVDDIVISRRAPGPETLDQLLTEFGKELIQDLPFNQKVTVAVTGFAAENEDYANLAVQAAGKVIDLIDTRAHAVVDTERLDRALESLGISLTELSDTGVALQLGGVVDADLVITGTIIGMTGSALIFARVVNTISEEVEPSARVQMPAALIE